MTETPELQQSPPQDAPPATTSAPVEQSAQPAQPGQLADERGDRALARFYLTSDLRAATGLTRTHLDFYLREGLIVPTARTESGYLLFDDTELATLRRVIDWRRDGIGLREIRERIGRDAQAPWPTATGTAAR